jgi:hypothetical protein
MPAYRKHIEAIREQIEKEYTERLSRSTCSYCRKARVEDSRGLCRECGAPADGEARQQHDGMACATLAIAAYRIGQY